MRFKIGPFDVKISKRNLLVENGFVSSQRQLYFRCPNCGTIVQMNSLANGQTILEWMKYQDVDDIESLTLCHNACGMEMEIAIKEIIGIETYEERN